MLTKALISRPSAELNAMQVVYMRTNGQSLVDAVESDLSRSTKDFFLAAITQSQPDPSAPPDRAGVHLQASALHSAVVRHRGTGALVAACAVLLARNDAQIRAVALEYNRLHGDLVRMVRASLMGHVKNAIALLLEGTLSTIYLPSSTIHPQLPSPIIYRPNPSSAVTVRGGSLKK